MSIYDYIGQQIREARKNARLSQDDLACRIGVTANTISRWETATYKIAIDDLYLLSIELNVPLSTLLPENNIMDNQTTELATELAAWNAMLKASHHLKEMKSEQRTDRDRHIAVTITELEKVMAYFNTYIMQPRTLSE